MCIKGVGGFLSGLTTADAQHTAEYDSCSDHVAACLSSSPRLELKTWKILRELLVFSLQGKPGKERSGVSDRVGELASKSETARQTTQFLFPYLGLKGVTN